MARKPEPPAPITWDKATAKLRPLGTVEAGDETEAIQKATAQYKVIASKLIAVRRR